MHAENNKFGHEQQPVPVDSYKNTYYLISPKLGWHWQSNTPSSASAPTQLFGYKTCYCMFHHRGNFFRDLNWKQMSCKLMSLS